MGLLTSLALLRLRMFSAMYLMLSIACLISGDTTEKATTVLMLCALSCRDIFPRSGVPGVSVSCRHGQGHLFPASSSMEDNLLSPNSRQLREPPPTCWRSQTDHRRPPPTFVNACEIVKNFRGFNGLLLNLLVKPESTLVRCSGVGTISDQTVFFYKVSSSWCCKRP